MPGPAWGRAWTARIDAVLTDLAGGLAARGLAVVALGSYARAQLCPASDVDLLLLHSGWGRDDLSSVVQRLCYPLWDAGLQVGHAVRSPAEAVRAAAERVETATALTDRRLVVGDAGLVEDLASRVDRWVRRAASSVLDDLAAEAAGRHLRTDPRPGMLEPHLKDGAGGLRDLQQLRWASAALLGEVGLDPLVGARYLSAADRRELSAAGDVLLQARCALHLVLGAAGRPAGTQIDRLRLDLQDDTAARCALVDADDLLRRVGLAMRTVDYLVQRTWPLLSEDARTGRRRLRSLVKGRGEPAEVDAGDGMLLSGGVVTVAEDRALATEPSLGLRALATAARHGTWLARPTAERLRGEVERCGQLPWDEAGRRALLEVLRSGSAGLAALADADHVGLLVAHLPEWARLRGRPQRNPLHRFDLDTHAVQAVAELVDLAHGERADRDAAVWASLADPDALLLAAFVHDVGKAWPERGDHSVVGAELAAGWLCRMGFGGSRPERIARLVRHHLLLPDVATRRDLDDPAELRRVAVAAQDVETLDGLFLLSLADARATGPTAHSPWKDGLVAELHRRVRLLLEAGDTPIPHAGDVASAMRADAGADLPAVEALLAAVGRRYLSAAGPEQALVHARLAAAPLGEGELRASARPGPAAATLAVSIVAADRLGLFAACGGTLAAHGLEVLDARAFTTETALALDWFVVRPRASGAADVGVVLADLDRAARGTLDVEAAVAARERRRDERRPSPAAPVTVDVHIDETADTPRIEVHGPDAPGVLYRLSRALADFGVEVLGARVATLGPQVRDVFFVRADPAVLRDPQLSDALRRAAA